MIRAEYFEGRLCVEGGWLIEAGIVSKANYDYNSKKANWIIARRGNNGNPALIEWDSMPTRFKNAIIALVGDPKKILLKSFLEQNIKPDAVASKFFNEYQLPDGRRLVQTNPDAAQRYYNNAIVLNAIHATISFRRNKRNALCNATTGIWNTICNELNGLDKRSYPHDLPSNVRRLSDKYRKYMREGYQSLISEKFCNINSRKVDEDLERLILSIYCMSNNPYASWVHDDYLKFLGGGLDVIDTRTGELFNRTDFFDDNGKPTVVSEGTVWNYINNPKNRAIVDSIRKGYHAFGSESRPHFHRHSAVYSLSKVSLDDRDLPRKMHNGKRVKAYYAYDVASGALIGAAYSVAKDTNLFIDCLRDMFRFLDRKGFGMPLEMEVENHIVRQFEDDLMKAGVVFPFIHWCAPTNSQEKHAEQFNRQKKYGYEKRYQDGIGRWYAKLEANRTNGERVYNDELHKHEIKEKTYSYEQLVADDLESIKQYNAGLHRNQKGKNTKGKTRMQVFEEMINPDALVQTNRAVLVKHIGEKTDSSIRRNQYARVQYADYQLSSPEDLAKLKPGNYNVQAYWLPEEDGSITHAYLYQGDEFICKAAKINTFTTATAEKTDVDTQNMTEQAKYITQFDKMVKDGREELARVKLMQVQNFDNITVEIDTTTAERDGDMDIEEMIEEYRGGWFEERAIATI